jgi:hypothetical protein
VASDLLWSDPLLDEPLHTHGWPSVGGGIRVEVEVNTTQTPECTKDEYNVKILKRKVSPKGLTNNLRRLKGERKKKRKGWRDNNKIKR